MSTTPTLPRIALGATTMLGQAMLAARREDARFTGKAPRMPLCFQLHPEHVAALAHEAAERGMYGTYLTRDDDWRWHWCGIVIHEDLRFTEPRLVNARNVVVPL